MESQNRKKGLELGHTHQPFCSEEDEPKNEGRCSGKPRKFTFVTSHNRMILRQKEYFRRTPLLQR